MRATHVADTYSGKIKLCCVKPDPANRNMVTGMVVFDHRYPILSPHWLHTGRKVYIAAQQVSPC